MSAALALIRVLARALVLFLLLFVFSFLFLLSIGTVFSAFLYVCMMCRLFSQGMHPLRDVNGKT